MPATPAFLPAFLPALRSRAFLAALRSSACLAACIAASGALAQAAPEPEASEDIIVVGTRPIAESEAAALAFQRNSVSLVSVVSSDAVGRLPDQNIAQAVSRLPGVSVQRDQGQARYVNLRGSPLQWTTLSFDGINVVSPEGRDARFDSLPSAIASKIVVQKAVTPDMSGETLAGNIDIITRSPFDYKGLNISAKAGGGYVQLGSKSEIEGSLVVSDRWKAGDGEIGLLVSGSYYRRDMVTDNFEIDWETVPQDQRPGFENRVWAREMENKLYRLQRRNWSLSGRLEWQPDSDTKLFVSSIYTIFLDDEFRDNYRIDADDQQARVPTGTAACPGPFPAPPAPNTTGYADICTGNTPITGTLYGVDFDARFRQTEYRQSVFTNTVGGDHIFDGWTVKWRGNYTRSVDDRTQPYLLTYTQPGFGSSGSGAVNRTTVRYDLRDPKASFFDLARTLRSSTGVLSRGEPVSRFEQLPNGLNTVNSLKAEDVTDAYTGKLDVAHETTVFGDTVFRFGLQFDQRTKEANEQDFTLSGATALTAAGIPLPLADLVAGGAPYRGKLVLGYTFDHFREDLAQQYVDKAAAVSTFKPILANYYKVGEQVWSGYAMAITTLDWGNIVYGGRLEHVKNTGEAFVTLAAGPTLITTKSSNTLFHPSMHINWNLTEDQKVRLSFNTGAARPDYPVLRPNFTFNDANQTISGGNPDAQPERARGVDLYWEYYVQPRGFVSVGVYYKDVRDILFGSSRLFNSDVLNEPGKDRSDYVLSTTINGGKGYIAGIEGAIQLQIDPFLKNDVWWGGFGIQANLALNTTEATTPDGRKIRFPGASDTVFNIGPYYEKYGISARLSYQKRTTWLSELGGPDTGGDLYWATDDELDASVRYSINRNLEVYFDASNLLNGPGRRFAGVSERTLEHETFGRRFTGGFRFTY